MMRDERGNVLFLILIAVALFAALSYAVTSSTSSGGDNDDSQVIGAARIVQYPSAIRTQIIRMVVSRNIDVDNLEFNSPENFDDLTEVDRGVFHPDGGGASFQLASADAVVGDQPGTWVFNSQNEVNFIGRSGSANNTFTEREAEVIAFLPDMQSSLCEQINDEAGILGSDGRPIIPTESGIDVSTLMDDSNGVCEGGCSGTIGEDQPELDGKQFGCFQQPQGTYNFYFVLVER